MLKIEKLKIPHQDLNLKKKKKNILNEQKLENNLKKKKKNLSFEKINQ